MHVAPRSGRPGGTRCLGAIAVAWAILAGCGGAWRMAPPPDTGTPPPRNRPGAHRHVHVPGEVRGERLMPVFGRAVVATVYRDGQWLVDSAGLEAVIDTLTTLAPTYVSSLFRFAPSERPSPRHVAVWQAARARIGRAQPQVRFDVQLDALGYASGPDVMDHMRRLDEALSPDLWSWLSWDDADRDAYDVVASASAQAHANGQAIGGVTRSTEIAADSDFGVLGARADAGSLVAQLTRLRRVHDLPYLVLRTPGSAGGDLGVGLRCLYAWRLAVGGATSGFSGAALADSLDRAIPCRRALPSRP